MANAVDDIVDATVTWTALPDATISWAFSSVTLSGVYEAGDVIWDGEGNPILDSDNLAINED